MHHPPAPVLGDGEIRAPPVAKRGHVEHGDGGGRYQEHHQERTLIARLAERRPNRPHHQAQPEEKAAEQRDLPEPAEVDVFVAAMTQIEPRGAGAEHLLHAQPLTCHRTDDDEQERGEQDVHAQALPLRLDPAHRRTDEEASGQPGRRDSENPSGRATCARSSTAGMRERKSHRTHSLRRRNERR